MDFNFKVWNALFCLFQLAGNYVKNIRNDQITAEHVKVAMYADPVS